ncbi:hypothetical protein GCM10010472_21480 [Pseudonocardia halophobica]|uniref:Uncharacterized protein n=1 Tax=Pseudonocardia halophobica TaxID=29401 RepID=A0A9W6KZM4_9PSEU|nr:hypothetical protein [Pseudonocardia halophobica]GLL09380.1 hypothetical protein GCM10017577_05200 [Pseudonocardia halophobica]
MTAREPHRPAPRDPRFDVDPDRTAPGRRGTTEFGIVPWWTAAAIVLLAAETVLGTAAAVVVGLLALGVGLKQWWTERRSPGEGTGDGRGRGDGGGGGGGGGGGLPRRPGPLTFPP